MVILTNLFPLLLSLTPILAPCQSPSITPNFCTEAKYSALEPYPYGESFETGFCAGLSFKLGTCGLFPSPSLPRQKFGMGLIWGWDRYLGFIFQALLMRRWWVSCIREPFSSFPPKIFQTGVDTWNGMIGQAIVQAHITALKMETMISGRRSSWRRLVI